METNNTNNSHVTEQQNISVPLVSDSAQPNYHMIGESTSNQDEKYDKGDIKPNKLVQKSVSAQEAGANIQESNAEEQKEIISANQEASNSNDTLQISGTSSIKSKTPKSPGPQPQKAMYIFSQIFEKSDDIKNKPFVFEKHNLKKKKIEDYKGIKMQSFLILPKKKSALSQEPVSLNEINHDLDNINVDQAKQSNCENAGAPQAKSANFKSKYFVFVENRIIQFTRDDDTVERGILNIKYARLKRTHLKDPQTKLFGFILMAKGQCIQFYNTSKQTIDEWITALKDTVILLDLKDDFKMGDLLGRGNFAKVHSCTRKGDPDETKYALKTIEKANIKKCQRNIQSVLQEIDILRKLQHHNVIKLHEVYESNKYIHLVLSYLDGGELFERIKSRHVYQEKTAISVMRHMLEALSYMHENKVVHRDLKPENLILASKDNDYDLRIADFGLASFVKQGELLKLRCGSPGYVAPEILEDLGYDEKSDVFSAGVILYVLLTGRPVFRGYNLNEILLKNKNCEIEYPEKYWNKISDKAKDVVTKLLTKDPKLRISAADALEHDWFNQDESEMNDQKLEVAEGLEENEKQAQLMVDYKKKPGENEQDLSILTATPILNKRNLYPDEPQTPFLTKNTLDKTNATPMMASGIIIQKAAAPKMQQMKGVQIAVLRPAGQNPGQKKMKLPEIPKFNREKGGKTNAWDILKAVQKNVNVNGKQGLSAVIPAPGETPPVLPGARGGLNPLGGAGPLPGGGKGPLPGGGKGPLPGGAGPLPGGAGPLPGGAGPLPGGAGPLPGGAGPLPKGPGLVPPPGLGGLGPAQLKGGLGGLRLGGGFGPLPTPKKQEDTKKIVEAPKNQVEALNQENNQINKQVNEDKDESLTDKQNELKQDIEKSEIQEKKLEKQDSQQAQNMAPKMSTEKQDSSKPESILQHNQPEEEKSETQKLEEIPHVQTSKMNPQQLEVLDAIKEKWSQNQPNVKIPGFQSILQSAEENDIQPAEKQQSPQNKDSNEIQIQQKSMKGSQDKSNIQQMDVVEDQNKSEEIPKQIEQQEENKQQIIQEGQDVAKEGPSNTDQIVPKDIDIVEEKYAKHDELLSKILEMNESNLSPSVGMSYLQDKEYKQKNSICLSKQSDFNISSSVFGSVNQEKGKHNRGQEEDHLKQVNENSGAEESSGPQPHPEQRSVGERRMRQQKDDSGFVNQESIREEEEQKYELVERNNKGMQQQLEKNMASNQLQDKSKEQLSLGIQIPLKNEEEQSQSILLANLELDPFKNPNAPLDLQKKVSKILENIDNQLSKLQIHQIYQRNLQDNVYNNVNQFNDEDMVIDDDANELNFLSSRFAEYGNLSLSERNIIGHRPQSQASQRSLNNQNPQAQNKNIKQYKSFIPAKDSDLNIRSMRNFERFGYGFCQDSINDNDQTKTKNKFLQDKQYYKNNGKQEVPPVRIFLNQNGQMEAGQDQKLNYNNSASKPVILAPILRQQVQAHPNLLMQQQQMLQQPGIPLNLPQGSNNQAISGEQQNIVQNSAVGKQQNIMAQNYMMPPNEQMARLNQGYGLVAPNGYQMGQDLGQLNMNNRNINMQGQQYMPQVMQNQQINMYNDNSNQKNIYGRADVGGRGGDQYLLNDSKDGQVSNGSPRGNFPQAIDRQGQIPNIQGPNQQPYNQIVNLLMQSNFNNLNQQQQIQLMQQQQLQFQMHQQYQYNGQQQPEEQKNWQNQALGSRGAQNNMQQFSQQMQGYGQGFQHHNMPYAVQQSHQLQQQQQQQMLMQNQQLLQQQSLQQQRLQLQNAQLQDQHSRQVQQQVAGQHLQRDVIAAKKSPHDAPRRQSATPQIKAQSSGSGSGDQIKSRSSQASKKSGAIQNRPFSEYKFSLAQEPVVEEVQDSSGAKEASNARNRDYMQ